MTDKDLGQTNEPRDEEFERRVEQELERRERERRERGQVEGNGRRERVQPAGGVRHRASDRAQTEEEERAARPARSEEDRGRSTEEGGSPAGLVVRGVVANGPWKMFLGFRVVIATALATGAYALIFPTLWLLADSFSWPRLVGLMMAAIVVMIGWMIISHGLWERHSDEAEKDPRISAGMQNVVTLLTLTMGVLISYAVLFGLIFLAALVFVDDGIFQSNVGHPVGPYDYAILAWVAASISTITGSLGGGLEDEDTVRDAVNIR